jgi:hypothetical protein
MTSRLRVIVSGLIAQYPVGGVTWDYVQYAAGLRALGHDVYYLEDSGQWPYNPVEGGAGRDAAFNAAYLAGVMSRFGLADRWAYRFPGGSLPDGTVFPEAWFGLSDARRRAIVRSADLLVNISSGIGAPDRYGEVRRLAYVDSDPVFTQIRWTQDSTFRRHVDAHHVHFSHGECLSSTSPSTGHVWHPLRPPVILAEWRPAASHRQVFTTVMNWTSYGDLVYRGEPYGQKDAEFMRYLELPRRVAPTILEVAVGVGRTRRVPRELLLEKGWRLVDPMAVCPDPDRYRQYVESSLGEWTVAKNGYVRGRAGWFSGRSACYLAAGRPVVVQDTGFAAVLPVGAGILPFRTLDEAAVALHCVEADYARHAKAARAIAAEYFDAFRVLSRLLAVVAGPDPGGPR